MKKILRDSLVPHEKNNFHPTLVQRGAMVGMGLLIVFSFLLANTQALLWLSSDWLVSTILPAVVVDLTNEERVAVSVRPLIRSPLLDQAANLKAAHMAAGQYFSHDSPDGITPWHWFREVGYTYAHAGENLAVYFSDSDEVVAAWMDSPTHRANIVNNTYQEIGIGTAKGKYQGRSTVFVVQLFGNPAKIPEVKQVEDIPIVALDVETTLESDTLLRSPSIVLGARVNSENKIAEEKNNNRQELVERETEFGTISLIETKEMLPDIGLPVTNFNQYLANANYFSSTIATSSGLTAKPVMLLNTKIMANNDVSFSAKLATRPNKVLQYLYIIIGAVTMFSLWYSIILGFRNKRFTEVRYGSFLLLLMTGLFYLNSIVTSGALIG